MKVTTALVVLLVFLFGCCTQTNGQQFTANCQVGNYSKPSAGLAACQFSYSWPKQSMLDSEGQNALLYVYNQWYGENLQLADPFVNQWEFKSGPGCPGGCETGRATYSMPRLWLNSNYTLAGQDASVTYGGQACYRFTPNALALRSNVTNIWFTTSTQQSSTNICRFDFSDGTYYLFSNVNNNPTFASNTFTSPSGCTCSKPIDIALVLDRSGSISVGEFQQELTFLHGFYNSFTYSTAKTMMGIVNFNTKAWGQYVPPNGKTAAYYSNPPALALSASPQAINATINGLSCCTGNTASDQVCCNGFTAIGSGMIGGANILSQSTRKANAAQMIVVITDGKQNTLYHSDPNSNAYNDCYYYNGNYLCCQYAIGSNCPDGVYSPGGGEGYYPGAQYLYCLGDCNYDGIVDAWQGGAAKQNCWPCGNNKAGCTTCGCPGVATCCLSQTDKNQAGGANCNGTFCSTDSKYQLNRLQVCHQDLIDSREYAFVQNPNTFIYAVGVGPDVSTTELKIIANNLYKRPANKAATYPVNGAWTPVYNTADNTNPERVLTVTDWNALSGYLQQIASQICDEPATPCGDCCGNCQCGTCACPTQCAQPANKCQQYVIPSCCCVLQNVTCPPQPCMDVVCDPSVGCKYTPRDCGANGCYKFSCNATTNACYPSQQLWKPADNPCFTSGCNTNTMTPYNNVPVSPPCSNQNTACNTYSCANATGLCVSTPVPPTSPAPNKCQTRQCDPVKGWTTTNNPCNPKNKCYSAACDVNTGQCVQTLLVCNNASNLCDLTQCDVNTGACPAKTYVQCPASTTDLCVGPGTCNPSTGQCVPPQRLNCNSTNCHTWSCLASTGACTPDSTAPCTGNCATANCGNAAGVDACHKRSCDLTHLNNNCDTWTNNTCDAENSTNTDTCIIGYYCDNAKGCVSIPTPDCAAPQPCYTLARNSSYPGCCQYTPINCDLGDPCYNAVCNPTNNQCEYTAKCVSNTTQCWTAGCTQADGTCYNNTIPCAAKNCYVNLGCDDLLGCQLQPKNCDDSNACTTDTCDSDNDNCVHTPITCNGTDLCQVYSCDPSVGCVTVPRNCDDGINCTTDSCDSSIGCVHVTQDSYCNDDNLCTNDSCSATDDCVNVHIECEWDGNDCDEPVCRATYGCQNDQIVCYLNSSGDPIRAINYYTAAYNNWTDAMKDNATNAQNEVIQQASDDLRNSNNCNFAVCSNNTCVLKQLACAAFDVTAVIAGAVTAGAIAGIVIAIVAALALGGGGAYYVAQSQSSEAAANVQTNPMFQAAGNGGDSPLYDPAAG